MSSSPESASLLARVARGDAAAVDACLERFGPLVWSLARRFLRDASGIEDVVQEIFIDLWRSAERYDPAKSSEASFVALIARRRIIDRGLRIGRAPAHEELDVAPLGRSDPGLAGIDTADEAQRVHAVLERLTPERRKLILMSVVQGLTHQDIATATGLPLGTVKSHIRRGLDEAARVLKARGEAER